MSTGRKFTKYARILFLCVVCAASALAGTGQKLRKAKKPQLPPLQSGPTGRPVPQVPLDSIAAVPPQVNYANGQLTIVAPNSTLSDILRAIKKQTGADVDVPVANERVVTRLGPGPAQDVMAELLNGSRFNYVLLGSPGDSNLLTRVVLVPKSPADTTVANNGAQQPMQAQQSMMQQANMTPPAEMATQDEQPDTSAEENAAPDDNSADQPPAEAEQQPDQGQGQPEIKTPQQMLQEMQQRQLQLQQQQQPGQPPVPGSGMPPHPPQQP